MSVADYSWRADLRAADVERRSRPDRGYVDQSPPSEPRKSSLLVPLSVLVDEEEKAVMADLLEEERENKRKREEDERLSGIRPSPAPLPVRPRIVEKRDLRRSQEPLRATLGDIAEHSRPDNETEALEVPTMPEPDDDIDAQIQALLAKHESQMRAREAPPAVTEQPTLLSRPEPPAPSPSTQPVDDEPDDEGEEFEDYHAHPGKRRGVTHSRDVREAIIAEWIERKSQEPGIYAQDFAREKGIAPSVMSQWCRHAGLNNRNHKSLGRQPTIELPPFRGERERSRERGSDGRVLYTTEFRRYLAKAYLDLNEADPAVTLATVSAAARVRPGQLGQWVQAFQQQREEPESMPRGHTVDDSTKRRAVEAFNNRGDKSVQAIADQFKVSKSMIYRWAAELKASQAPTARPSRGLSRAVDSIVTNGNDDGERDVGTVMAELNAAKERVKQLKAELIELL